VPQPCTRATRPVNPLAEPTLSRPRADHWVRELILAAVLYEVYNLIQHLLTGGTAHAQHNGRDLFDWERRLHLDPERFLNNLFDAHTVVAVPACYVYATLHFLVTPAVLIWAYRARPAAYRQARTVLIVMTVSALAGFRWFPTAPPRLLDGAGFTDTLAHFSRWGWWGSDALPSAASSLANQYAAMPSLHVGWAVWSGATVYTLTHRRAIRVLALAYPAVTTLVVLGTGNHYLLDAVAGAALWLLAFVLVHCYAPLRRAAMRTVARRRHPSPESSPVGDGSPPGAGEASAPSDRSVVSGDSDHA
jgi:PAP2 superfamily protein